METFMYAKITKAKTIVLEQAQKRAPEAHELLIRVKASAVCGSDMHIYSGMHPYVQLPTTIGHELSGIVEAIGPEVTCFTPGDRVCVEPLMTCGECYYCKRGHYDYCQNLKLKYRSGFSAYAEYYYADERWVHHLPDSMSFDEGALMEPFACSVHAAMKADIKLCDSVAVVGDGPIALMLAQLAIASGAIKVYVLGLLERNLKLAEAFGAIPMKSTAASVEEIKKLTEGRGVDIAFEAVGRPVTFLQTIDLVKRGGKAVIFGIFEQDFNARPLIDAMVREVEVIGTSSYCWDFQRGIDLVSSGRVNLKPLITHHFKLTDVKRAMDLKSDAADQPIKIILEP